jgi:hypothetical protein|nr:MAG TPA: hypothetical protein [Caudoviricetes sp.]
MNFSDWYTDTVDIWRVVPTTTNGLTSYTLTELYTGIPCRIYQSDNQPINMEQTAAHVKQADRLMCDVATDIKAGDQLIIHRGAGLGHTVPEIRAFAADPNLYFEPFGAVLPGLAHMEVRLLQQEIT